MSECYELSLTPNYVSDWTFNDALRELIQNGIDQETIRPDNKFSTINEQIQNIAQKKDTLCRRMYN